MHPSSSGLLVTWAYFPWMTLPPCVTRPILLTFTSMTVPLVITPKLIHNGDEGFFFTPSTGKQKVAFSSGCVTWAFLKRNPIGLINLSYLGGFQVKPSPTKQALVTILFQAFFFLFPVRITFNTSFSPWAQTLGRGTSHFPIFSFCFCLIISESTLAWDCPSQSSRYAGTAPCGVFSSFLCFVFLFSCILIVFFICIFSLWRCLW